MARTGIEPTTRVKFILGNTKADVTNLVLDPSGSEQHGSFSRSFTLGGEHHDTQLTHTHAEEAGYTIYFSAIDSYNPTTNASSCPSLLFVSICSQGNCRSRQGPNLVGVVVRAFPDLHNVTVCEVSVGEVETLTWDSCA